MKHTKAFAEKFTYVIFFISYINMKTLVAELLYPGQKMKIKFK